MKRNPQLEQFASYCRARGLSVTHQRLAIFEGLSASREHPSAEQLHRAVSRKLPSAAAKAACALCTEATGKHSLQQD